MAHITCSDPLAQFISVRFTPRKAPSIAVPILSRFPLWALLIVLTTTLGGCSSDDKPTSRSTPPAGSGGANANQPAVPPPPQSTQSDAAEDTPEEEDGDGQQADETPQSADGDQANDEGANDEGTDPDTEQADGETEEDEPTEPEERTLPENLVDWTKEDYFAARTENDPRLLEAVAYLGKQFVGNSNVAQGLADLLGPPKVDENGQEKPAGGQRDPKPLIGAVVAALDTNGSDAARSIMEQLLAGKLSSSDDLAAVDAVLAALAAKTDAKDEDILFRALTEAEKLRPQADGQVKAEDLRKKTLDVITPIASDRFRTRLAQYLIRPDTPDEVRKTMAAFLEENHPSNLGAQLIFCRSDKTSKELKAKLEAYFTNYGSQTMRQILGLQGTASAAANRSDGKSDPVAADPDLCYRLADQLWGTESVALIENRLKSLDSLDKQETLLGLAGSIPLDSTRSILLQSLETYWNDAPKALEAAGLTKDLIGDPGLVLVVKTLANRRPTSRTLGKAAIEKFKDTREEWAKSSETLIRAWFDRCHLTATASSAVSQPVQPHPGEDNSATGLPISLHKEAHVAAAYQANWPGDLTGKLSGVTPGWMQMYYVRIEENRAPKTTLAFYKHQLNALDVRGDQDFVWVESFRKVPKTERKRSIDVLIERANKKTTQSDEPAPETEDLVIQILSIEINAPVGTGK